MCREIEYLARTLYGEARGENLETQLYVAWVIRNRVTAKSWGGETYQEVVTQPQQFSCWNKNNPNYAGVNNPTGPAWLCCQGIAQAVYYAEEKNNPVAGLYYFFDQSRDHKLPSWAKDAEIVRFDFIPNLRFVSGEK